MPKAHRINAASPQALRVSLLVLPESMAGPLIGLYEDFNGLPWARAFFEDIGDFRPIEAEIVTPGASYDVTANDLPIRAQKTLKEVGSTDVVIISSLYLPASGWVKGRHPEAIEWLRRMHEGGALLCSTCTGVFPLAETGLLDGLDATVHWGMAKLFSDCFPNTRLRIRDALVVSGKRREFAMGGASASWHDMLLYVVSRFSNPDIARALAKFLLINWHQDGQAFCGRFTPPRDHGDGAMLTLQRWLDENHAVVNPVEEMQRKSGLPERTFKRRFTNATGLSPIAYVQELRVEKAKASLESSNESVERISWLVGYEDPSSFRSLFKRLTGITPGEYRRKYKLPDGI